MPPPASPLLLAEKVLLVTVIWFQFPIPPPVEAELPEIVLPVTVSAPLAVFMMAPPTPLLLTFAEKRLFVMVNVPLLSRPAPQQPSTRPWVTIRLSSVA